MFRDFGYKTELIILGILIIVFFCHGAQVHLKINEGVYANFHKNINCWELYCYIFQHHLMPSPAKFKLMFCWKRRYSLIQIE